MLRSENEERWRNLLIEIKNFLRSKSEKFHFEMYKFIGDGWVLLFDIDINPARLFYLLKKLNEKYVQLFKKKIEPVLSIDVARIGLTFGMDCGNLVHMIMNRNHEYIGRPLNIAARLQSAIGDMDKAPQGKVLMSNSVYASLKEDLPEKYRVQSVRRTLKNISGGNNYRCTKLWL